MKKEWNLLQSEQIELGRKGGLSEKEIALYAKRKYNFLQMQDIRTALMNHDDPAQMKAMCRASLSHQEMEALRLRIEKGEKVYEPLDMRYLLAAAALSVFGVTIAIFGYQRAGEYADLCMTKDTAVLHAGDVFEPMDYVASYSADADRLVLPQEIDTSVPGRKAAVYRLCRGNEEITRILIVDVREDQKS